MTPDDVRRSIVHLRDGMNQVGGQAKPITVGEHTLYLVAFLAERELARMEGEAKRQHPSHPHITLTPSKHWMVPKHGEV